MAPNAMIAVILLLVELGAFPAHGQMPTVRDSAGIIIVHNPSPSLPRVPSIRVADRPTLQIGTEDGDRNYQFAQIIDATQLANGSIAIADRTSGQIRIFDRSGKFVRRFGRRGQGPGEFLSLRDVRALPADSLIAWDGTAGRLTVFDPMGDVVRTFTPHGDTARSMRPAGLVRGAFRDGQLVLSRIVYPPAPEIRAITRDTLFVGLYSRNGDYIGPIGRFLGLETLQRSGGSMVLPDGRAVGAYSISGVPFARETLLHTASEWLYVGEGQSYEIRCYDRSGSLGRIIRMDWTPRRVTSAMIAQHRKQPRRRDSPSRPNADVNIDKSFYPSTLPPYAAFLVDGSDRLWVQDYPAPGERPRWNVFDREGRLVASAVTPPGLDVLEIGTNYLLGVWRDELEVEYLRVYSFSAPH